MAALHFVHCTIDRQLIRLESQVCALRRAALVMQVGDSRVCLKGRKKPDFGANKL